MLGKRSFLTAGAFMASAAALAACQDGRSGAGRAGGTQAAPAAVAQASRPLTPEEEREVSRYVPSFLVGEHNPSAPHTLDFFWSPSCDSSAQRFTSVIMPLLEDRAVAAKVNVACHALPRSSGDAQICASLRAVRNEDFGPLVAAWLHVLTRRPRGRNAPLPGVSTVDQLVQALSLRRQDRFDAERAFRTMELAATYGIRQLGITETPTAFVDGSRRLTESGLTVDSLRGMLA